MYGLHSGTECVAVRAPKFGIVCTHSLNDVPHPGSCRYYGIWAGRAGSLGKKGGLRATSPTLPALCAETEPDLS